MNSVSQTPPTISRYARVHGIVWKTTAVVWAGLIFYLSTGAFGGNFTEWLLRQILGILHVAASAGALELLHHLLRKLAHLTEYAIFAMLLYGSATDDHPFRWRPKRVLWCIALPALYSLTDEFHQRFVPGRGPSLTDCGIDTVGATLGILVYYLRHRLHYARNLSD